MWNVLYVNDGRIISWLTKLNKLLTTWLQASYKSHVTVAGQVDLTTMRLAIVLVVTLCGVWQTFAKPYPEDWSRCRKQYETLRAEVRHLQKTISQLQYAVSKCSKYYIKGKNKIVNFLRIEWNK